MSETFSYDPTPDAEVMSSIESDEAESLAIGDALEQEQNSLLAGKYRNAEELEQAYVELQRKLGSQDPDEDTESEEYQQDDEEEYTEDEIDESYTGFFDGINEEFASNGELSEETLNEFSNMSSRDLVQAYMRYQSQNQQQYVPQGVELSPTEVNQIQNSVGGEAAYQQLTGWAAENFSNEEVQAFDQVVESGNTAAINLALEALYYRYTDAMGYEGEMIQGKPARSMDTFKSQAELVRAMSDKRYDNDPAYRQDVIDKLDRSDVQF